MLVVLLPLVGVVVALTVLWDALDRGFRGRPQDGVLMNFVRQVNVRTQPFTSAYLKNPEDGFIFNTVLLLGVAVPIFWAFCLRHTLLHGFSLPLFVCYHLFRLGPYFMNFAYSYTLFHKEGHSRDGLWKEPYNAVLRNVFNWWVGLFFGVMPSSFTFGHSINHHKYSNGPLDVVSSSDKPRDSVRSLVEYLPRWALYALNISTFRQFLFEGRYDIAFRIFCGSAYWVAFATLIWRLSPLFCMAYVIFPVGENILLLACVNWCWHAFLDPNDPSDPYVGSVTLLDGPINVLQEDFHVVHHQYPGVHWSRNPELYKRHDDEYKSHNATVFRGTHVFELFFFIILGNYDLMAKHMVDVSGKYPTREAKIACLQERLRVCWWGPLATKRYIQTGWEGVEDSDGYKAN